MPQLEVTVFQGKGLKVLNYHDYTRGKFVERTPGHYVFDHDDREMVEDMEDAVHDIFNKCGIKFEAHIYPDGP